MVVRHGMAQMDICVPGQRQKHSGIKKGKIALLSERFLTTVDNRLASAHPRLPPS